MTRIGLLMSDTGGGHRAAGRAIEAALHCLYPNAFECEYFDVFRRCGLPPLNRAPEIYPWWVKRHQPSYDLFVSLTDRQMRTRLGRRGLPGWAIRKRPCREALDRWQVIVVLHAGFSGFALATRRAAGRRIPVVAVSVDMAYPHSGWYHPDLDLCLVPTAVAYERGRELGVPPEKLRLVGHPVHPKFARADLDRAQARAELGWDKDAPTALIVSGAEGMSGLEHISRAVDGLGAHLAIVAGRNEQLAARLRQVRWTSRAHVYGFVTNMEVLMRAADVVIGKPGTGMIAEAAISGLPMILTAGMVNELANVRFVSEAGAGVYARTPEEVRAVLSSWVTSPAEILRRRENTKKIAHPNAAFDIAGAIASLARPAARTAAPL